MNEIMRIWRHLLNEGFYGPGPIVEPIEEDKLLPKDSPTEEECEDIDNEDHRCFKYTKKKKQDKYRPARRNKKTIKIKIR